MSAEVRRVASVFAPRSSGEPGAGLVVQVPTEQGCQDEAVRVPLRWSIAQHVLTVVGTLTGLIRSGGHLPAWAHGAVLIALPSAIGASWQAPLVMPSSK